MGNPKMKNETRGMCGYLMIFTRFRQSRRIVHHLIDFHIFFIFLEINFVFQRCHRSMVERNNHFLFFLYNVVGPSGAMQTAHTYSHSHVNLGIRRVGETT